MTDDPLTFSCTTDTAATRTLPVRPQRDPAATLRRVVGDVLVHRALTPYLSARSRVLAIGGNATTQARLLAAAGHSVTVLEPNQDVLDVASDALRGESGEIRDRIQLVRGGVDCAGALVGANFDLVCCHGILTHVTNIDLLLAALVKAASPRGVISLLTRNADAGPLSLASRGCWADAVAVLDDGIAAGLRAIREYGHRVDDLALRMALLDAPMTRWHGVRMATDHLDHDLSPRDQHDAIELEWQLGQRDPYRACAQMLHLICTKTSSENLQ